MVTVADAKKLKVNELKEELTKLGLPTTGKKDELLARLIAHLERSISPVAPVSPATIAVPKSPLKTTVAVSEPKVVSPTSPKSIAVSQSVKTPAPVVPGVSIKQEHVTSPVTASEGALGEEERRKKRAERFGLPVTDSIEQKKAERAARFGLPVSSGTTPSTEKSVKVGKGPNKIEIDPEVLKKRAERFGVVSKLVAKSIEDEKKQKRADRFGAEEGGESKKVKV